MKNIKNKLKNIFEEKTIEQQFLPAVLEITDTPPSPMGRALTYVIIAIFTVIILIATLTNVDIIAIGVGKIISNGKIKLIQPLKSGVVFEVYVKDGQSVKKDEPLVKIKFEDSEANKNRVEQELMFANADISRYSALLEDNPLKSFNPPKIISESMLAKQKQLLNIDYEKLTNELKLVDDQITQANAEKTTVKSEIERVKRLIPNINERVNLYRTLYEKRLVAKSQFLEIEQQLFDYEETSKINQNRLKEAEAKLSLLKRQKEQVKIDFKNEIMYKLAEALNKKELYEKELQNVTWVDGLTEIKAPEDGIIQELEIYTIGGIVTPAQTLMKLVPVNADLEAEVMILNKDIGFVNEGQDATVKIDSFPYTKYGWIDGTIINISKDAIENEKLGLIYNAKIALKKDYIIVEGKRIKLSAGMTVTAEAKTGKRKLIEYIIAPFIRYKSESMRER